MTLRQSSLIQFLSLFLLSTVLTVQAQESNLDAGHSDTDVYVFSSIFLVVVFGFFYIRRRRSLE